MAFAGSLVFDFDSTLVSAESLDELARIALRGQPRQAELVTALRHITVQGMAGELTFDASLRERLSLFTPTRAHLHALNDLLAHRLNPSVERHTDWFRSHAHQIYVLSGGFRDFIEPVTDRLGLTRDHVLANDFVYSGENITGFAADNPLCRPQGKARHLRLLHLPRPIIMIGDGYTDYETVEYGAADQFWCYTETVSRPNACKHADRLVAGMEAVIAALRSLPAKQKTLV